MSNAPLGLGAYPPYDEIHFHTRMSWALLKAMLFGQKYDERSGPFRIIAYYHKRKFYITRYDAL
jgi:hypothetical protein